MAEPSNIRVNPFTGTGGATNYVELTEKHIIPTNSPYVIRLNEVPEKQDPSNMKMVYVDSATGDATENTLTEVAATPGQREFRPDYSTNALDDKTWNTGLIEFSASDAGKIVQVTYTGTGTLAGVTNNKWSDFFTDKGHGAEGDFVPTKNTTIKGTHNYTSVYIKSGITVTIDQYALIKCQGAFVNDGIITADGKGRQPYMPDTEYQDSSLLSGMSGGNAGAGKIDNVTAAGGSGTVLYGGYDTRDAEVVKSLSIYAFNGYTYGAAGGGGDSGGAGGGAIAIITNSFKNTGKITANGTNGKPYNSNNAGGGGAGGGITIVTNILVSKGTVTANGGAAGNTSISAKGGNGFVYFRELGV